MSSGKDDDRYSGQDRGDSGSYERYLRGMDQSMRQKVALTAAHLLGEGRVADMGMGSGSGTLALASLYPRVQVIGVDVNPKMVARAKDMHRLPNLDFVEGDIATPVFEEASLDGIFDSSVLHHVTSFTGYDHEAAARALTAQSAQLAPGGSLVVRDFVSPGEGEVLLDLPNDDGDPESSEPGEMSSAALLQLFSRQFRKLHEAPGFELEQLDSSADGPPLAAGWTRFRLDRRMAAEFLLRKDYRSDWETEVLEEYTYFTQARFESEFRRLGLRLLASFPIHNPWIVKNRFEGKAHLWDLEGNALPFPATNHLIVGEKTKQGEGVAFSLGEQAPPVGFLKRHAFRFQEREETRELVRRPGTALDVVPWFEEAGALFVLARKGHPRPVLCVQEEFASLDGGAPIGYVTEPILVLQSDKPIALTVEEALLSAAAVAPEGIRSLRAAGHYYPSPGGIVEEVRGVHVEVAPTYVQRDVDNDSGFSTGGRVRAIDAAQVLRAAQVGALPDVRLELNVYELLLQEGKEVGPWIGASLDVPEVEGPAPVDFAGLELPPRRAYVPTEVSSQGAFLEVHCRAFTEVDEKGAGIATGDREYVLPRHLSGNTISALLVRRVGGQFLVALDEDDLAAAQCFSGSSALWVTPAWRLPRSVATLSAARSFAREKLEKEYGVTASELVELGGRYHPSAGITPEVVYPQLVSVAELGKGERPLTWVRLDELIASLHKIQDGHTRIGALRAAHCLLPSLPAMRRG